jgi:hypothetical protein
MTKQEFLNLPTTKKTMNILQQLSSKGFRSLEANSFESKHWVFFGEIAASMRNFYKMPKAVRDLMDKPSTEKLYNDLVRIKSYGYRKELNLPF